MTEDSTEKTEKVQLEGVIERDKVRISDIRGIEEFYNPSYIGTIEENSDAQDILVLDSVEVLLLCERNRILIWKDNDKIKKLYDFEDLLMHFTQYDERLWQRYIIYMDLRKRGYIVRAGYGEGIEFRVYKRGADFEKDTARYLIYPVFEGTPIELRDLDKISRVALGSRKDLIVATVDRLSKPIYYSVKKFQLLNKEESNDD